MAIYGALPVSVPRFFRHGVGARRQDRGVPTMGCRDRRISPVRIRPAGSILAARAPLGRNAFAMADSGSRPGPVPRWCSCRVPDEAAERPGVGRRQVLGGLTAAGALALAGW